MKKNIKRAQNIMMIILLLIGILPLENGCKKNEENNFIADFSYEFKDDNHLKFINNSTGEYYSLQWDFGNGETETTTEKNKSFEIYYPVAGNYNVKLTVLNYTGDTQTVSKTVNILKSDLELSFTAEPVSGNANLIHLVNTSIGDFDSFSWIYRNKTIENQQEANAYFPFVGQYTIELKVMNGTDTFSKTKTISIAMDDPNYVDNLVLTWSDEFEGTNVNADNWTFETGATGWGNNELQNYTNGDNAEVTDGKLIITARKINDDKTIGSYTSSRLVTSGKQEFKYGRMEIRAKLPSGTGIWPAIWMLGSNFKTAGWPACGEVDIMEYVGYQPNIVHSTIHTPAGYGDSGSGTSVALETCEEAFHNYGIIYTEKYIKFYIDTPNNIIHTYAPPLKTSDNWPFDQPLFFILNVAVGGNWGGAQGIDNSIFPQSMEVEYVRVYQEKEN